MGIMHLRHALLLTAAGLVPGPSARAQGAASADDAPPVLDALTTLDPTSRDMIATMLYGVGTICALMVVGVGYYLYRRYQTILYNERVAEAAFQAQMLHMARQAELAAAPAPGSIGLGGFDSEDVIPSTATPATADTAESPAAPASPYAAEAVVAAIAGRSEFGGDFVASAAAVVTTPHLSPADAAAKVVKQLQAAGIVESVENYLTLNGIARAAIEVRLKNRKRAIVVGYMESEPFLRQNLHRFDQVFMVLPGGQGLLLQTVEQLIADRFQ